MCSSDLDYDNAYRLTGASSSAGTYGYGLDPTDNITSFKSPTGSTSANYNELNQIKDFGSYVYVYDKNGSVLDDGLRTYKWDAENRLLSVTSKANSALKTAFRYDGLGRRTAIDTTNGMTSETRYLWCGEQLCQARTSTDTVSRRYYSEGEYLPLGGTSLYYSQDQLRSVRDVLATQNGSRVGSFDYDPYGNPSESNDQIGTNFRYAGMFYDQQDGLYLTQYRIYSPAVGHWLSRDPVDGYPASVNSYVYALNNPIVFQDPDGRFVWLIPLLIGALTGALTDLGLQLIENGGQWGCVDLGSIGRSAALGALFGSLGPSGVLFGRARYLGGIGRTIFNSGEVRVGWSWLEEEGTNWFSIHGDIPGGHSDLFPGPSGPATLPFGVGGGAVGGGLGNATANCNCPH